MGPLGEGAVESRGPTPTCLSLVLSYFALSCYVVFLVLRFSTKPKRATIWNNVARMLLGCHRKSGTPKGMEDTRVRALVAQERVRCVRKFTHPFVHCLAVYVFTYCLTPLLWGRCEGPEQYITLKSAEEIQLVLQLLICMAFDAIPRLVTTRTIEAAYAIFTAWWVIRILLIDQADIPVAVFSVSIWRAILGTLVCNACITSACNLLLMIAHCLALQQRYQVETLAASGDRDYLVVQEVGTALLIVCMLFLFEHWVWAAARYTLEIKASSQAEVTVRRLLSALCDAVVTLGPDLRISERAPKLANLLLQGGSAKALAGMHFLDLMVDTDQERFQHFLARAPDHADSRNDPEPAQALNVHLRDSSGISVQVQLFISPFQDLNDQAGHLIGICEVGDTGANGGARVEAGMTRTVADASLVGSARQSADSDSEASFIGDSVSVVFSRNLGSERLVLRGSPRIYEETRWGVGQRADPARRGEVVMVFDTLRFRVMDRQSPQPVIDANLLEKESLQQWVAEWASSRAWMQDFVNAVLRPVSPGSWPGLAGPPASLSFQVSFRGSCPLPPDILTRVPAQVAAQSPMSNPDGATRLKRPGLGSSSSVGAGAEDGGARGPPTKLPIHRVRVSRRSRLNPTSEVPHAPSVVSIGSSVSSEYAPRRYPSTAEMHRLRPSVGNLLRNERMPPAEGGPGAATRGSIRCMQL